MSSETKRNVIIEAVKATFKLRRDLYDVAPTEAQADKAANEIASVACEQLAGRPKLSAVDVIALLIPAQEKSWSRWADCG